MSMAATGSDGQYSLNLPQGEYQVFTIQSGKVYYYADAGTTQNENSATLLSLSSGDKLSGKDLTIPSYNKTISGSVAMDNGDPVPNALVKARNQNGDSQAMDLTASDGTFTLTGLSDGSYVVKMDPIGTDYPIQTQSADAGDSGIDFVIKTLNTLSGQVTDGSENPVQGAMLYLVNRDTGMIQGGRTYSSDAEGMYSISGIPNGVYKLVVLHKDYEAYEQSGLRIDQDLTHNVILSSGAWIKGTVTDADTENPLHNVLIVVTGGDKPQYDLTGKQGGYEVNGLVDGQTYTLNAKKSGYEPKTLSVNASSNGTTENFSLAEPQAVFDLNGTVTLDDANGTAVENAVVVVHSPYQQFKDSTTTDQDGNYSFADLPQAEDYSVVVVPPGDLQVQTTTLNLNADTTDFDVVIPSGNAISGIVIWSENGYVDLLLFDASTDELIAWQTLESDETKFQFRGLTSDQSYKVLALQNGKSGKFSSEITPASGNAISIDLTE
jgi:protocatechuate 3,4-dioxygenase beta subunit